MVAIMAYYSRASLRRCFLTLSLSLLVLFNVLIRVLPIGRVRLDDTFDREILEQGYAVDARADRNTGVAAGLDVAAAVAASASTSDGSQRVLILASMRTGSSFVGELLGNSRDIFYLFEPGHSMWLRLPDEKASSDQGEDLLLDMLYKMFRCDFHQLDFYLKYLARQPFKTLQHRVPRLYEVCVSGSNATFVPDDAGCVVTASAAERSCRASKHIVFKEIRITDMKKLLPMINDKDINLKVIHLVRDPRPVIMSMVKVMEDRPKLSRSNTESKSLLTDFAKRALSWYCTNNLRNFQLVQRSDAFRGRYMFLRYEDVAKNPLGAARRIYSFLGQRRVPKSVLTWIETNTRSVYGQQDDFATQKNSNQVFQAWRRRIPFNLAREIEQQGRCAEMMNLMGYRLLESEHHLKDLSQSLVGNIVQNAYT